MHRIVLALTVALLATASIAVAASAAPSQEGDLLPDLDQEVPKDLRVERVRVGPHVVFRLGFAAATGNVGPGPLRLHGHRTGRRGRMQVDQLVARRAGGVRVERGVGRMSYTVHPDHDHWHLLGFAHYELRAPGDDRPSLRRDRKTGFCLGDRYRVPNARALPGFRPVSAQAHLCGLGRRAISSLFMGISTGYADRYEAHIEGQYIDITDAPARKYVLVHTADPDGRLVESDRTNNSSSVLFSLAWPNGRRALPRVVVLRRCPASASCPG